MIDVEYPATHIGAFLVYPALFMADKVQARTHKKKRINKKWRKRYGEKEIPWKTIYVFPESKTIFAHPKTIEWIKKESLYTDFMDAIKQSAEQTN